MQDKNKPNDLDINEDLFPDDYFAVDTFGDSLPSEPLLTTVVASVPELQMLYDLMNHYESEDIVPEEMLDSYTVMMYKLKTAIDIPQPTLYINVYRVSSCYGGPEEGGWYYTARECLHADPYTYGDKLLEAIPELFEAYFDEPENFIDVDINGLWCASSPNPSTRNVIIAEHPTYNEYYEIRIETGPAISSTVERPKYE